MQKEVSERKERQGERKDFMEYIQTAKEKDGSLSYHDNDINEVVSEARLLVVAGQYESHAHHGTGSLITDRF